MGENVLVTSSDALGAYLTKPEWRTSLEQAIYPSVVFLQLGRRVPVRTTQEIYLPPQVSTGPSFEWLGEGERKPISDMEFSRQSLRCDRKVATITPFSEELELDSFVSMRSAIQTAIASAAAVEIDSNLWNGLPDTDTERPTGLLQQSGFLSHSYGQESDLGRDMKAMIRQMRVNNREPTSFAMHSTVLDKLQGIEDGNNHPKYMSTFANPPSIWGVGITISNNIPATAGTDDEYTSTVILGRWPDVWVATMPSRSRLIDQATLVKSDSSELHLAQEDLVGIRWLQRISSPVVRHGESVCLMTDVIA